MSTLNIIGCGRVGRTLARLWRAHGTVAVQDVLTRSASSASDAIAFIGSGRAVGNLKEMRPADIWMLAVPDREIARMALQLAQSIHPQSPVIAFHCSGALGSDALTALKSGNWQIASAHCLLSFANPATALMQFEDTPCALEGDALATQALAQVFAQIGARCFALAAKDKLLYHAGAVFATNFLPVLQSVAQQLWRDSGMPADLVTTMQATLLKNAVDNLLALGPAGALTGPAARGDVALVQRQAKAVTDWDTTAGDAYKALSQLAIRLASHPAPPIKDSTLFNQ